MNKVLHGLVYVFLALAVAALYFELALNDKRDELTKRNRMQEEYLIKIAKTIESQDPAKDAAFEIRKDASPVEAKIVDSPEWENVLDGYQGPLEQRDIAPYDWDNNATRDQLRTVFIYDGEGKPVMDGDQRQTRDSPEDKLLQKLFKSAQDQQSRLNTTRAALSDMRERFEAVVNELNKLKPEARQDKVTIVERDQKIEGLESDKAELTDQITKKNAQIGDLNTEIASLKDEVTAAKDETEAAKDDIAKKSKTIEQLKQMVREMIQQQRGSKVGGTAVASVPVGDKGKLVEVNNDYMFAVVEFTDAAMQELKGKDLSRPLPALEFGVKRADGNFVGRIQLRQEVKGKNFVICDILGAWEQDKLAVNDIVFAD